MTNDIDRFGMPLGWGLIAIGNVLGFVATHGLAILGAAAAVVGMGCQIYTTYLRHQDYADRKRRRDARPGESGMTVDRCSGQ